MALDVPVMLFRKFEADSCVLLEASHVAGARAYLTDAAQGWLTSVDKARASASISTGFSQR